MMWHGLTYRGLAHTRTVRERYHRSKRNSWNEVDCGSHYARSVASYGLFVGICGFEYHGPKGYLAFSPRLTPESLRVTFASAQGWGTSSRIHTNCEEARRSKRNQREFVVAGPQGPEFEFRQMELRRGLFQGPGARAMR